MQMIGKKRSGTMPGSESVPEESTYPIDAENAAEMARLMRMALLITEDMGELFPPNLDPTSVLWALDIACGPGQWVLEAAKSSSQIEVTGIDISRMMVAYARTLARELPYSNAHFQVMDARQPLDFPDNSFNFVNARFISPFMLTSDWPGLLAECWRILQPGGMLRLIECETLGFTNSAALEQCNALLIQSLRRTGHCFAPAGNLVGMTPMLPRLLQEQGFQEIQHRAYALDFSAKTKANTIWYDNYRTALKLAQPFFLKWGGATQQEIDVLYLNALEDMRSPKFCGLWFYFAATGEKPV
jgi:ubiquinone/menaquinone biosynthesis C-methylase UbiE